MTPEQKKEKTIAYLKQLINALLHNKPINPLNSIATIPETVMAIVENDEGKKIYVN